MNVLKRMRKGFTAIELVLVLVIIGLITVAVLVKMSGETQSAVVDGLKDELSVVTTKTRAIALQRAKRYEGLDAAGLKLYGNTIPYKIDEVSNKIYSNIAGGCYWTVNSVSPYTKFNVKLDCAESGWSAGAIDGENEDIKARIVSTLKDFATLSLQIPETSITEDRSAGKLEVTLSGII